MHARVRKVLQALDHQHRVRWNLPPAMLVEEAVCQEGAMLSDRGALHVDTGKFTGRSPRDRYIVRDDWTDSRVDWGEINIPMAPETFERLLDRVMAYLISRDQVYVRDMYVGAHPRYRIRVRIVNERAWQNLFVHHMFIRPSVPELETFEPDWYVVVMPGVQAIPSQDGIRAENFVVIHFSERIVLIGGTAYSGEIKKSMFTVMNFLLPVEHQVLPMHCSANVGTSGDVALFFGLSGTGKTTLSTDPERKLIGDDEHGWGDDGVFNFEGGCYAKTIHLDPQKEPLIYDAIRFPAVVENVPFFRGTRIPDFDSDVRTENTRAAYPLEHLGNAFVPSGRGDHPSTIFFLTFDAYGVLPPVALLTPEQAYVFFLLGYTSKVAGTEMGVTEPQATFSGCFGAPFMPLPHDIYARMLLERLKKHSVKVWLLNTGIHGDPRKGARRVALPLTRRLLHDALSGALEKGEFQELPVFHLQIPRCEGCDPRDKWETVSDWEERARELLKRFVDQIRKYSREALQPAWNVIQRWEEEVSATV